MKNALFNFREEFEPSPELKCFNRAIVDQVKQRGLSAIAPHEDRVVISQLLLGIPQSMIVELSIGGNTPRYPARFSSTTVNGSFASSFIEFFVDKNEVETPLQDLITQKVASSIEKLHAQRDPWWVFYKKRLPPSYFLESALAQGLFNRKDFRLIPREVNRLSPKHFRELMDCHKEWLETSRHNKGLHWSDRASWHIRGVTQGINDAFWRPVVTMMVDFEDVGP